MRFFALIAVLFCAAPPSLVAQGIGDKVMPKMDAVAIHDGRNVPWPSHMVPFVVREIGEDGRLRNGDYWVAAQHAVPLPEAEAYYDGLLPDHPYDAKLYRYRGIARRDTRQWRGALSDFGMAIEMAPDDADNYCDRGEAHFTQGEYESSLADFDHAIRLAPDSARAFFLRGEFWFHTEEFQNAIADFTRVIEIDPEFPRAFTRRACAWNRTGEFASARADFEEAVRRHAHDPYAFRMASWFFTMCKDPDSRDGDLAVKYAQQYCELTNWKSAEPLDLLAHGYALKGDFEKAIELLKRAIELGGDPVSFGAVIEQFKKRIYNPGSG